jgi:hypothetical protein
VLEGVVDILSGAISHALDLPYRTNPNEFEVWVVAYTGKQGLAG